MDWIDEKETNSHPLKRKLSTALPFQYFVFRIDHMYRSINFIFKLNLGPQIPNLDGGFEFVGFIIYLIFVKKKQKTKKSKLNNMIYMLFFFFSMTRFVICLCFSWRLDKFFLYMAIFIIKKLSITNSHLSVIACLLCMINVNWQK